MKRIGLSGGIAAGKSTASAQFANLGATVIDYDQLSRDAVAPSSPVLNQIATEFGVDYLHDDGTLNRQLMANKVFNDPTARQTLENLIHPWVFRQGQQLEQLAIAKNPDAIVIHDIPLLVEKRLEKQFDGVIIVQTNSETRAERLVQTRGMSPTEAAARINAGATDEERRAVATYLLDGNGSSENLERQVAELWAEL